MSGETILLVEDESDIRELVQFHLEKESFRFIAAQNGEQVLPLLRTVKPDLILLDLMLPGMDGAEVCRQLQANPESRDIPIIMLTAKNSEGDVIGGLELGAADYMTKPFSPRVLVARIHAVLRRPDPLTAEVGGAIPLEIGALTIDPVRFRAEIRGKDIHLTRTEFRILHLLASNPGLAFTRKQIVERVRGGAEAVTVRVIDVQMVSLRKKLRQQGSWIQTVRGIGYRFKEM